MSSTSWRVNNLGDDQDDLPACALCRKRKLRCSRDTPTCQNCDRTGSQCTYDPKSKPGLKTGAVEALNRRLAVLETLLLDEGGNPLVTFTKEGQVVRQNDQQSGRSAKLDLLPVAGTSQDIISSKEDEAAWARSGFDHGTKCSHGCERRTRAEASGQVGSFRFNTNDRNSLVQALPARDILIQVVDFFCNSFHHWIPFLHKGRCQAEVRQTNLNPEFAPILHALVAVVLPLLDGTDRPMNHENIHRQTRVSKNLALQYSVTNANLQSLQALLILVFQQLNDGGILQTCPLIALLVRTVDFLQLTTEPGASRSQGVMKPLEILEPATDWTELEGRRRLFWCIFTLDRFTSAHTGWNTSLTAEDVYRRLPADGGYFTRERPVQCPFFGLWNKAYANLGSSLSAHIPAQYRNESPPASTAAEIDSTTPGSQTSTSIDSSKLGAFAYSIEAIESLNQVTTFFLQQRIEWQNRQHVLDWLTRFKELDLRLIHWKMFLPPRWKDSNISVDTTRIDMDPNLTLAHLIHNTSMILLHYPVAFPPAEWDEVVQLPSACSAETCQMAAIEISRITDKFLRHTSIPFVSPQFSFCVYVAAKLLLVLSRKNKKPVLPEFSNLLQSLWQISRCWLQLEKEDHGNSGASDRRPTQAPSVLCEEEPDLAGSYARHLEEIHQQSHESAEVHCDFFDHSGTQSRVTRHAAGHGGDSATTDSHSHAVERRGKSNTAMQNMHAAAVGSHQHDRPRKDSRRRRAWSPPAVNSPAAARVKKRRENEHQWQMPSPQAALLAAASSSGLNHRAYPLHSPSPSPDIDNVYSTAVTTTTTTNTNANVHPQPPPRPAWHSTTTNSEAWPQQEDADYALFDLSEALMHPQFLQQDRVISYEDMHFQTSNLDWS